MLPVPNALGWCVGACAASPVFLSRHWTSGRDVRASVAVIGRFVQGSVTCILLILALDGRVCDTDESAAGTFVPAGGVPGGTFSSLFLHRSGEGDSSVFGSVRVPFISSFFGGPGPACGWRSSLAWSDWLRSGRLGCSLAGWWIFAASFPAPTSFSLSDPLLFRPWLRLFSFWRGAV